VKNQFLKVKKWKICGIYFCGFGRNQCH